MAAHVATGSFRAAPSPRHLGPARSGKGIERLLRAMSMIRIEPAVTLDIIGQTHPKVLARSGQSYRNQLQRLCSDLGLASRVGFVDRYLEDGELQRLVSEPMLW